MAGTYGQLRSVRPVQARDQYEPAARSAGRSRHGSGDLGDGRYYEGGVSSRRTPSENCINTRAVEYQGGVFRVAVLTQYSYSTIKSDLLIQYSTNRFRCFPPKNPETRKLNDAQVGATKMATHEEPPSKDELST
jgi:hypothetical protein